MTNKPAQAAEALLARARQRQAEGETRRAELRARLPALAQLLRSSYGARDVFLFGSLAWGGFHARSDVDVAVSGIDPERRRDAEVAACGVMSATVELFRLESLPVAFRDRILREGEAIA